jgi:hypothetical protein
MASNTDTVLTDPGTGTGTVGQDIRPRRRRSLPRRALPWVAVAAAAITTAGLAVSVFADDGNDAATPANRAALQHDAERYVESLESRAASVGPTNRVALQHEAARYVDWLETRAASIPGGDGSTDGFVPANLPALQHEAERYVEWLASRAASASGQPTR